MLLVIAGLAAAKAPLDGQMVYGRVLEAGSQQGVPQALVEVLQGGSVVTQTVADSTGSYRVSLPARTGGSYRLRVTRLGFATQESPPIDVAASDILEVDLRIAASPIPIAELMVEVARNDLRHAASIEGLHARRARARSVGQERVVVAGDPELQHVTRVQQVMDQFFFGMTSSRTRCTDYYVNGIRRDDSVLELPADMIEGVEYYVDGRFAPFGLMGGRCSNGYRYSVVAVWLRRPSGH
jgi:hypothetical protein